METNLDQLIKHLLYILNPLSSSTLVVLGATLLAKITNKSLGLKNGVFEKTKAVALLTTTQVIAFKFRLLED